MIPLPISLTLGKWKKFHGIYQTYGSVKGKLRHYGKYESILSTRGFTTEKSISE